MASGRNSKQVNTEKEQKAEIKNKIGQTVKMNESEEVVNRKEVSRNSEESVMKIAEELSRGQ